MRSKLAAALLAIAAVAIAGCATTTVETHKPVGSRQAAEAAFLQAFVAEAHAHGTEVSCHYEEGEWHCIADGHKGSGEEEECVDDIGTVSKTGEIGATSNSGGAALPYCAHYLPRRGV